MPYEIRMEDNKHCVYNKDTGENKGCSDTRKEAEAHMSAMYAAEKKTLVSKAFQGLLTQDECAYTSLSLTRGKACANCRWFLPEDNECYICSDDPEPILATGYCNRWEATPAPVEADVAPIPVTIVEPPTDEMDSQEMALPTTGKSLREFIVSTIKGLVPDREEPAFSVFKAQDGKHYWLARHTGKFVDREQEILADKAHEEYVARVQAGKVPMPELWAWHKKGTRHGQADMVWKSGGFTLALGHFDDTPEAQKAIAFYQKHKGKIKLSHMFNYPKRAKQGRVFYAYNTVEITTLPDGAEAFPYTSFEEIVPMLSDTQRAFIKELGGDEMLSRVEAADTKAAKDTSALEALGVESKGLDNFEGSTIPENKELEALKADVDTRLKAFEGLPAQVEALQTVIKTLNSELAQERLVKNTTLEKLNSLEKQLLEYTALAPPSSKSKDTLLNTREKSLIDGVMAEAEKENTLSLVDMALGNKPSLTAQQ